MTKVCCICNRIKTADRWVAERQFHDGEVVTHGYCPACFDGVMVEIEKFMSSRHGMRRAGGQMQTTAGTW